MSKYKYQASIVVPVYNDLNIKNCLESLQDQNTEYNYEIIIVNDGSTNNKVLEAINTFSGVKIYNQKNQGPAAARNLGAKYALGDYLCFIDADARADLNWLQRLIDRQRMKNGEKIGVIGGGICSRAKTLWGKAYDLNMFASCHPSFGESEKLVLPTMNFSIKKDLFFRFNGFRLDYRTSEDFDFCLRLHSVGLKNWFYPKAIVYHYHERHYAKAVIGSCWRSGKNRGGFVRVKWKNKSVKNEPSFRYFPNHYLKLLVLMWPLSLASVLLLIKSAYHFDKKVIWLFFHLWFLKLVWLLGAVLCLKKYQAELKL